MAGHNHPRIAERTTIALRRVSFNESHLEPAPRAIVRRAQANDSAAYDEDALSHLTILSPNKMGLYRPEVALLRRSQKLYP